MSTRLSRQSWSVSGDPGLTRVAVPLAPEGQYSLRVPVGQIPQGTTCTLWLPQPNSAVESESQSVDVYLKPEFHGGGGATSATAFLRFDTGFDGNTASNGLAITTVWDQVSNTRRLVVRTIVGQVSTTLVDKAIAPALELAEAVRLQGFVTDIGTSDVHIQVDINGINVENLRLEGSSFYGVRGVWALGFTPSGESNDFVLIDLFAGDLLQPTVAAPDLGSGPSGVWLYASLTPDTANSIPTFETGNAFTFPFGGSAADFSTESGELLFSIGAPIANDSLPANEIPSEGYRFAGKLGRLPETSGPQALIYVCFNPAGPAAYGVMLGAGASLTKFSGTSTELDSNSTVMPFNGMPFDILVRPNAGLEVYLNGELALTSNDTELMAASQVMLGGNSIPLGYKGPLLITADLNPQQGVEVPPPPEVAGVFEHFEVAAHGDSVAIVQILDGQGTSVREASADPGAYRPGGLSLVGIADGFEASWFEVPGATSYHVYVTNQGPGQQSGSPAAVVSAPVANLTGYGNGVQLWVVVTAVIDSVETAPSEERTTHTGAFETPTGFAMQTQRSANDWCEMGATWDYNLGLTYYQYFVTEGSYGVPASPSEVVAAYQSRTQALPNGEGIWWTGITFDENYYVVLTAEDPNNPGTETAPTAIEVVRVDTI